MEQVLKVQNFSKPETFIEFLYLHGMHQASEKLSVALNLNTFLNEIKSKYNMTINLSNENKEELKRLLKERHLDCHPNGLCDIESYFYLNQIAKNLNKGCKILEIGTYKGASTLALAKGAQDSFSSLTCIDIYMGFGEDDSISKSSSPMHYDYNLWQRNLNIYANNIESLHGSSVGLLRTLVEKGEKYDLIFLDTAHSIDTHYEVSLISCLNKKTSIIILDDVIDFNHDMTNAWALGLQYFFCFPRFANKFAVANFKESPLPINYQYDPCSIFLVSTQLNQIFNQFQGVNFKAEIIQNKVNEFTVRFSDQL